MTNAIHIITSCTDRKRADAGEPVRIRDVRAQSIKTRAKRWWEKLGTVSVRVPARELYVGAHWSIANELPDVARDKGMKSRLWVASAGYGFVPADKELSSYSATFATRQADAVAPKLSGSEARDAHRAWWSELAKYGRSRREPRTIRKLASLNPKALLLVVASPDYVGAMEDDLVQARDELADPDRLIIVSSDQAGRFPELEANWVPTDARLVDRVGGSMISLNAAVARDLLKRTAPQNLIPDRLRARYLKLAKESPDMPSYDDRKTMTDADVKSLIGKLTKANPKLSRTGALRELRSSGHKCEQSRFKRLWEEARGGS